MPSPPRVYPQGGSRICPLNRGNELGMVMLDLGRVTGDAVYLERAARLARFFRQGCQLLPGGQLVWEYLPQRYALDGEDIGHACVQIFFTLACVRDGVVLTVADLHAMAATLRTLIFRHGDVPALTVRGYGVGFDPAVGAYSALAHFAPEVLPRIVAVVETLMDEEKFNFKEQGWGIRVLTLIEKARVDLGHAAR